MSINRLHKQPKPEDKNIYPFLKHYCKNIKGDVGYEAISEDAFGGLWLGTNGEGLNNYDRLNDDWTLYRHSGRDPNSLSNNVVQSILQDRQGDLWIGTLGGGLDRFDPETNTWHQYRNDPADPHSLSNNNVNSVYEDREGVLWIGRLN